MKNHLIAKCLCLVIFAFSINYCMSDVESESISEYDSEDTMGALMLIALTMDNRTPDCSTDIKYPTPVANVEKGTVIHGQSCHYQYIADSVTPQLPEFLLTIGYGNADLYVGMLNDPTGGTEANNNCSQESTGGGWIRCSRKPGNSVEKVGTVAPDILSMERGEYRIISIYGSPAYNKSSFILRVFSGNEESVTECDSVSGCDCCTESENKGCY